LPQQQEFSELKVALQVIA